MSDDYNPFIDQSNDDSCNPFDDQEQDEDLYANKSEKSTKSSTQVSDENEQNIARLTYTSLDGQQQANTIMRSLSIDEDILDVSSISSDSQDLIVRVDKPEKHTEGYVSYCVTSKSTRQEYEAGEYQVRRRYQDFLWLRQKLFECHPTHIIPPLPEKFTFSKHIKDKFDSDFLRTRQKALHKFMNRVAFHPVISFNENVKTFLTAKAWEMTTARKNQSGTASLIGGSVRNTAAQFLMKNRSEEFSDVMKYNVQFQAKIKTFANITENIAEEQFYMMDDYSEYSSAFQLWANSETRLADTLHAVSQSFEKNKASLKNLLRTHESRVCEPLREYLLYSDAVKDAMKRRDQFQIEQELSADELNKKRLEKEELESSNAKSISAFFSKDPEKAREEKISKLNQQIKELLLESDLLSDRREKADHDFKADLERWEKTKKRDLKELFLDIAERHIKFYEANTAAWQEAYEAISKPSKTHTVV
ncbi:sorting nexin-7 [Hydra vulgaris]|uniref:Sorting nexin-7 n=1 Tax=Hydra vulgaris TaxID=6087 RepID=T2M3V2_HYDVU|nr:sorting nexin-7 [Hydra vulgaris]